MPGCEKCWSEAGIRATSGSAWKTKTDHYHDILDEHKAAGVTCTPEEQCGELHVIELGGALRCRCGKVTRSPDA